MGQEKNKRRSLLTAGAGLAVLTALEGVACGNPVEPQFCPDNGQDHYYCIKPDLAPSRDLSAEFSDDLAIPADLLDAGADSGPDGR